MNKLEHALAYAKLGLRIFPCLPNTKIPIKKKENELKGGAYISSCDPIKIQEWWGENPNYNIALACGHFSGVIMTDYDCKDGKQGLEKLNELVAKFPELSFAPRQRTWSGGAQLFHKYLDNEDFPQLQELWGCVDTRSTGGYAMLPGSVIDGIEYEWEAGRDIFDNPLISFSKEFRATLLNAPRINSKMFKEMGIIHGGRQYAVFIRACDLRGQGLEIDEISEILISEKSNYEFKQNDQNEMHNDDWLKKLADRVCKTYIKGNRQKEIEVEIPNFKSPEPIFPNMLLKGKIGEAIITESNNLLLPPEVLYTNYQSLIGSLLSKKFILQPKKNDTSHTIYPNSWSLTILPTGKRKSAALKNVGTYLHKLQEMENKDYNIRFKAYNRNKHVWETEITIGKFDIKKEGNEYKRLDISQKIARAEENIDQQKPDMHYYFLSKATPEGLKTQMSLNRCASMLLMKDEITSLSKDFTKKEHGAIIEDFLEMYEGKSVISEFTKNNGNTYLSYPLLSIIGATTTDGFNSYFGGNKEYRVNGLLPRFDMICYPNINQFETTLKDIETKFSTDILKMLIQLDIYNRPNITFNDQDGKVITHTSKKLVFGEKAYKQWMNIATNTYKEIHKNNMANSCDFNNAYLSRFATTIGKFCIRFHVIDHLERGEDLKDIETHISEDTLNEAIIATDYYKSQFFNLFNLSENDRDKKPYFLLKKMIYANLSKTTFRELSRRFSVPKNELLKCLRQLEKAGFLKIDKKSKNQMEINIIPINTEPYEDFIDEL